MHTFKAAQPALLYLSPACILSTLITGSLRGELGQVFEFNANPNANKAVKKTAKDTDKKKTDKVEKVDSTPISDRPRRSITKKSN